MKTLKCKLCGYEWVPRLFEEPKACPRCKRYDWNESKSKANIDGR